MDSELTAPRIDDIETYSYPSRCGFLSITILIHLFQTLPLLIGIEELTTRKGSGAMGD
jgi:hypothetical protein